MQRVNAPEVGTVAEQDSVAAAVWVGVLAEIHLIHLCVDPASGGPVVVLSALAELQLGLEQAALGGVTAITAERKTGAEETQVQVQVRISDSPSSETALRRKLYVVLLLSRREAKGISVAEAEHSSEVRVYGLGLTALWRPKPPISAGHAAFWDGPFETTEEPAVAVAVFSPVWQTQVLSVGWREYFSPPISKLKLVRPPYQLFAVVVEQPGRTRA